jgi:hypothetical protein
VFAACARRDCPRGPSVRTPGSIWAAGTGALGVEFHADFDWSFFEQGRMTLLDYCSASSRGECTTDSCDESTFI